MVLASDLKIAIQQASHFFYPDASVVCGEPEFYKNRSDTILNPTLIVEVLSDSTEDFDRSKKFTKYRQLSSFQEYLLISQDEKKIEVYTRKGANIWQMRMYNEQDTVIGLERLGIEIAIDALYERVVFEQG